MKNKYCIGKLKTIKRVSVYDSEKSESEWIPDSHYGFFNTPVEAKLAFMVAMKELNPEKTDYSKDFINRRFKCHVVCGNAKVLKVPIDFSF